MLSGNVTSIINLIVCGISH